MKPKPHTKHVVSSRRFDAHVRVQRQRLRDRVLDKLAQQETEGDTP